MSRLQKPTAQRKKLGHGRHAHDVGLPFPNFALGKTEMPAVCRCIFDGTKFFVTNHLDMHTLHYNGSFGTSSLTFRGLSYDDTSFAHRPYYQKLCLRNATETPVFPMNGVHAEPIGGTTGVNVKYLKSGLGKRLKVAVEPSKSGPELCVHISPEASTSSCSKTDPQNDSIRPRTDSEMSVDDDGESGPKFGSDLKESQECKQDNLASCSGSQSREYPPRVPKIDAHALEEEKLILMPEEAIFLSFGVGCLAIYNLQGQALDYRQCWRNLVTLNRDFPARYAAYHYFRGKNWVPKKGDDYGASYLLYEGGPDMNHATYIVYVLESTKPKPTWLELSAWQRLATHSSKHVLLCEVSVPKEFRPEVSEPRSVFDMTLREMSLMRWLPHDLQIS